MLAVLPQLISCESFLETDNEKSVSAHEELTTYEALCSTTANLYTSPWYFFHKQRFIQLGDARSNNLFISDSASNDYNSLGTFNEKKENASMSHAWGSLYNVVTQSSYVIEDYAPYCVTNGVCTQEEANVCLAEARFMRAMAYWFLAIYWHDVPIVDNAATVSVVAFANRFEDVIQYAICEAEFARRWLPEVPYQTGRVSKSSASGLLSRLYLTAGAYADGGHFSDDFRERVLDKYYSGDYDYQASSNLSEFYYAKAIDASREVIASAAMAGYGLMDDYEEIFRVQNNNCSEVLFALQFVSGNTTTGLGNDLQEFLCYDKCMDNNYGQAYSTWASYDFVNVSIMRGGLKRNRGNVFANDMTYDYLFHENDKYSQKGDVWVVADRDVLPVKKHVVGGPMATGNQSFKGNSSFNTPMLRMSEVYLNLTEALMGYRGLEETTDSEILEGVNAVRRRAHKFEIENGSYRGDYGETGVFTLDSLLQERRLEFFMEGLFWSDIVRRSYKGDVHLKRMLDYANNKLIETEGDPAMGSYRMYKYKYKSAGNDTEFGTVTLSQTNGQYKISRQSCECVHNIPEGSYCHSDSFGQEDNLWSMIYPPTETAKDPNLLAPPVKYDFSEIIEHKYEYNE